MARDTWMMDRAKEELKNLEAHHPSRFDYLKLELQSLISDYDLDPSFPNLLSSSSSPSAGTQVMHLVLAELSGTQTSPISSPPFLPPSCQFSTTIYDRSISKSGEIPKNICEEQQGSRIHLSSSSSRPSSPLSFKRRGKKTIGTELTAQENKTGDKRLNVFSF
ncbi:uncharacterized protein LOC110022412 isoform X1 [Phalaenopsis equestris]|uniref:uncharacterized protein LOC110022412 isoform X1 n=1 Tax=Phalaenopsis equestris TaxID=78828 RepID=UPI0009E4485C|nr:uncharacterized protein LOC110022412 isoform X1 [Phalaenopsis equestris]